MSSQLQFASAGPRDDGSGRRTPLTIALGIHHLAPRGGLEDNCIRIGEDLAKRGHKVTFFVAGKHPDLPIETVSLSRSSRHLFNHSRAASFAQEFIASTSGRFDRTVAFQPVPGVDILFTADWLRDRPDLPAWRRLTPRFRTYVGLEKECFSDHSTTRIIGLAEPQMQAYVARYGTASDRIAIVPPTLPHGKRKAGHRTEAVRNRVRTELGLAAKVPLWLWLGLQPAVKGLDRVLAALEHHPQTHLLVCGVLPDSKKAARYRSDAAKSGLADRVHWLGYVSEERLQDYFAAADVLAHPARLDITGGVILESIVNGLPVVATGICGFAEHVRKSGAGMVIPEPFDPEAFRTALEKVCGPDNADYSARGIAYGDTPSLYSGTSVACDLIEAERWPLPGGAL